MSLEILLANSLIEKIAVSKTLVQNALQLAHRDLKAAKNSLHSRDFDWALAIAHQAALQAGRAFMFSKGYRPRGDSEAKHKTVIDFIEAVLGKELRATIFLLDKARQRRHRVVYEEADITSESEALSAINRAEEFVNFIQNLLKQNGF